MNYLLLAADAFQYTYYTAPVVCTRYYILMCVAVRIILTYSLFSYIPKLVSTFKANPEAYTCSGFIILLEQSEHEDRLELLDFMYSCCFDDDYGVKLKKRIQESIDNINNA